MEKLNEDIFDSIFKKDAGFETRKEDAKGPLDKFYNMLKNGIVKFVYLKKDGYTVRTAYGTKAKDFMGPAHGGVCIPKEYAGYTTYYDMDQNAWRVFHDCFLLRIESDRPMNEEEYEKAKLQDEIDHRGEQDEEETRKYKSYHGDLRKIPFYLKDEYVYPGTWETKKTKKTI